MRSLSVEMEARKPWRPELDVWIEQGLEAKEIAEKIGISRQAVSQYITKSGQYASWKQKRIEQSKAYERKFQQQALALLDRRIEELAIQNGWSHQKAIEFMHTRMWTTYSLDQLVTLFDNYKYVTDRGIKLSVHELSVSTSIHPTEVARILKGVGLEPMHGKFERYITSDKKEALERAIKSNLSGNDLAYFLNLPESRVNVFLSNHQRSRGVKSRYVKQFGGNKDKEFLTYRLASQIYEAKDAGFTRDETIYLLDTSKRVINYAISNKKPISKKIVRALRALYPKEKITKPYRITKHYF